MKSNYETSLDNLTAYTTTHERLTTEYRAIADAISAQRETVAQHEELLDQRTDALQKLEDSAAHAALSVEDRKPLEKAQKEIDELDKAIRLAGVQATAANAAISGLNRRLLAADAEIKEHQAKLPGLHGEALKARAQVELAIFEKAYRQLAASYAIISAAGIWHARLTGSKHPRLENVFKNIGGTKPPVFWGLSTIDFDQAEHAELIKIQMELKRAGLSADLPSGMY